MAAFSAEVLPTGKVRFTVNQGLYLGELPAGISDHVQILATTLERAGMVAKVTPSMQSIEWSKYVTFVGAMPLAVLTRLETSKFLQEQHTASIEASLLHEMAQIATTRGIALEDVAFFHAKTLSQLSLADTIAHLRHQGEQRALQAPTHKLSALQDLEQGKRLEVEETLGYAVRQGAALGIPTPTMDVCYQLMAGINHYLQ